MSYVDLSELAWALVTPWAYGRATPYGDIPQIQVWVGFEPTTYCARLVEKKTYISYNVVESENTEITTFLLKTWSGIIAVFFRPIDRSSE